MLDIQLFRKDIHAVAMRLATRPFALDVAGFQTLEAERKDVQMRTQELQAKRNSLSKQVGALKIQNCNNRFSYCNFTRLFYRNRMRCSFHFAADA